MRKLTSLFLTLLVISQAFALSNGPPDNVVGNPTACNQCHNSFALNSGGGNLNIEGLPNFKYEPGKEYIITISVHQADQKRFGFEATVVLEKDMMHRAGEINVLEPDLTQISFSSLEAPQYIKHTRAGTFSGMINGTAQWEFKWTAPPSGSGTVVFFVAGNAASNDNTNQGDYIYTHKEVLREGK